MELITELNLQANKICDELREARKESKEAWGATAAYHKGRAEELEKWLASVEALIEKITERKEAERKKKKWLDWS